VYGRKGDAGMRYRVYCEACWPNRNNESEWNRRDRYHFLFNFLFM